MELILVTCNIRFDNPADGPNAWPLRRDFLAQTLLSHSPDIIATQEGRFHQLKELETLLPDFEMLDPHRSWIGERMYPTLFVRKNKFEFLKSQDIWLSETPHVAGSHSFESAFPRLMTMASLQIKDTARKLMVVNTHLDHVKALTRCSQIQVLTEQLKMIWNKEAYLFIMGDFNDSPDSEVRSYLLKEIAGLQDSWKLFNKNEESSHHAFAGRATDGSRIDWIMVDKRAQVVSSRMDKSSQDGKFPTDHFPIITKVKL
jgi:endonuclease/exonuclease/phosphatase family metal-dependent hydrolase